uniref:Uncharacterized protein ORF-c08_056 n=1 Tax=Saccharolobus solfataricus TaxID=2287 RepID=Q9UWZ4_SACSO|nr:hypothetical protein [Saccharolobus solfataricus P2]
MELFHSIYFTTFSISITTISLAPAAFTLAITSGSISSSATVITSHMSDLLNLVIAGANIAGSEFITPSSLLSGTFMNIIFLPLAAIAPFIIVRSKLILSASSFFIQFLFPITTA